MTEKNSSHDNLDNLNKVDNINNESNLPVSYENVSSFDELNLPENLLRGIY